jgi:hypothetical protein
MSPQERPEAQGNPRDPVETYEVLFGEEARRQFDWVLAAGGPADLEKAITQVLALGPQPHPYRRIRADGDGYRLAWKDWRVSFRLEGRRVHIRNLGTGYKPRELAEGRAPDLHIAFEAKFGSGTSDLR